VRRLGDEGIVEASLLGRSRSQQSDDRLVRLVAGIAASRTLQQIAAQLEAMRERTPPGGHAMASLLGQAPPDSRGAARHGRPGVLASHAWGLGMIPVNS